jgi:hypothetical protein
MLQQRKRGEMKPQLFAKLETAISKVLDSVSEDNLWDGYIYHDLTVDMSRAAELVFDASMKGQAFKESEEK